MYVLFLLWGWNEESWWCCKGGGRNWRPSVRDTDGEKKIKPLSYEMYLLSAPDCLMLKAVETGFTCNPRGSRHVHNIQAYKKKDWFISESFFFSFCLLSKHKDTHMHTQTSPYAGSTQCRKSQLYAYTFVITEAVVSVLCCECICLRLHSCMNKRNNQKIRDRLCSVYHPWSEKMWCQKGKSVFMA